MTKTVRYLPSTVALALLAYVWVSEGWSGARWKAEDEQDQEQTLADADGTDLRYREAIKKTNEKLKKLNVAYADYYEATGEPPETLDDYVDDPGAPHWNGPYLEPDELVDAWGRPFIFRMGGRGENRYPRVRSMGKLLADLDYATKTGNAIHRRKLMRGAAIFSAALAADLAVAMWLLDRYRSRRRRRVSLRVVTK